MVLSGCDKIVTAMKTRMNDNVSINAVGLYRDEFRLEYGVSGYRRGGVDEQTRMFTDEL